MSNATPDTFICLAAGKGTRMGRLSSYLQKCMYPLDGLAEQYRVRPSSIDLERYLRLRPLKQA